ncbi:hypothetical protein [Erysipelothrix rhusiopathiae]|uniref:hypothetical protein n=1 Tax=Erysipelothrix rhusiopathiae TaxID=1648 RepID=UPI000DFB7969|nr:hypothetical protein [Erysipelothrix rhusiopathiae]STD01535.1 Uncharacterised protein [Erysipelothrix rhusiopathiae]
MKVYAVYKGEDILAIGTVEEIAKILRIKPESVLFYNSKTYKKRTSENARRLVEI